MKRILKIEEYKNSENYYDRAVKLKITDENENPLQGTISIEQLDDIQVELWPQEPEDCAKETEAPRYFVYNPMHEGKPQKIYNSYEEAKQDAKDIAGKYDRCNIYVLQIVAEIEKKNFVHETIKERGEVIEESSWESVPF